MAKYTKKKSYWKKKNDKIFAEIIKLRANNLCQETKSQSNLQCCHIVPRSYLSTRWDFDNALCLDIKRHYYYTNHPVEWRKFIGEKKLTELEERALRYRSWSLEDLKELYGRMEKIRHCFNKRTRTFEDRTNPGRF